jgi:DNA-binding NarL/FixJ family response regulator
MIMAIPEHRPSLDPARTARVLVADDHALIRRLLRTVMESHPGLHVVGEAADGSTAVELAGSLEPDVLVIDLTMPGMAGLDAIAAVRASQPGCGIVVFSALEATAAAARALAAGADRYVEKDAGVGAVAAAAVAVAAGR